MSAAVRPSEGGAASAWNVSLTESSSLPSMAWVLRARERVASIACGDQVRQLAGGVYEGTWVGEPHVAGILASTTTFGSGILVDGDSLVLVPPSHMLEGIYTCERAGTLWASNSLAGLLTAADLELDPAIDYPQVFAQSGDGIFRFAVPTRSEDVHILMYDGLRIRFDGSTAAFERPREEPFGSFTDYRSRLTAALASALANAPDFEAVAMISSGYDSAGMATLAQELGCRRAVTIPVGKAVKGSRSLSDSGETVGRALGMDVAAYDRLGYMNRQDLAEADFLSTGMSGEDVVFSGMEPSLRRSVLVSGFYGDGMWWSHVPIRPLFWRLEQAGASLGEFRLRVGFVHVPLPWFGASERPSVRAITVSDEMRPWVLGMFNDRPIPRRILEEAGIPRGSFAGAKRATSAGIHSDGPSALATATVQSVRDFAGGESRPFTFRRRPFPKWRRIGLTLARRLRVRRAYAWLERPRRKAVRHQPEFGNLLLRWAVDTVKPRYSAAAAILGADRSLEEADAT